MRILVIDDEENVLRALGRLLRRKPGIELVTAMSGEEALPLLEQGDFDAVVVDQHLGPGLMTGGDILRVVARRSPAARRVLCSGGSLGPRDDASALLAHALLEKPCTVEDILEAVRPTPAAVAAGE